MIREKQLQLRMMLLLSTALATSSSLAVNDPSENSVTVFPAEGNVQCQDYATNKLISELDGPTSTDMVSDGTATANYVLADPQTVLSFSNATKPIDYALLKSSKEVKVLIYPSGGVFEDSNMRLDSGDAIASFALCYGLDNVAVVIDQSPTAAFTASCADRTCSFDASASYDPEEGDLEFLWTFGDGTADDTSGATVSHTYDGDGTSFTVTLTVTDPSENSGVITQPVSVAEADTTPLTLPSCSLLPPGTVYQGDDSDATIDATMVTCPTDRASLVCNFDWTTPDDTVTENFGLNDTGMCCWCNPDLVDSVSDTPITGKLCFPDLPYDETNPDPLACPPIDVKAFNQILLEQNGGRVCFVRDGRPVCYY
jgi:hypothetical protein